MKRTKDGRIYDKRVKVPQYLINKILLNYKSTHKITWSQFAREFGVSSYTIRYDWRKGNTIPLGLLKNILKLGTDINWNSIKNKVRILEPYWGQRIGKRSKLKTEIEFPEIEKSIFFAEFYGILLGDGCVYSNLSGLCISGNSVLDKNYLEEYVSNLMYLLFGLKPRIYYSPKGKIVRCVLYNRAIARFLIKKCLPKGNKKSKNVKIPKIFFKSDILVRACIRGLNDTDGSVYPQKNSKIILDISIKIKSLLNSAIIAFNKISFPINYTNNRIYLCGRKSVALFFHTIGSSNLRHIIKYQMYLKNGKVPLSLGMERLLKKKKEIDIELPYYGPVV